MHPFETLSVAVRPGCFPDSVGLRDLGSDLHRALGDVVQARLQTSDLDVAG